LAAVAEDVDGSRLRRSGCILVAQQKRRTLGSARCTNGREYVKSIVEAPSPNKRVPPALTTFAPGNTARVASRVGTLERYLK